jgi:Protein of unknown function
VRSAMYDTHDLSADVSLTPQQRVRLQQLSASDISLIDAVLLQSAAPSWRNVARLVASAMHRLPGPVAALPESFYAHRIRELVTQGRLESLGDLARMRYSEVRLPAPHDPESHAVAPGNGRTSDAC